MSRAPSDPSGLTDRCGCPLGGSSEKPSEFLTSPMDSPFGDPFGDFPPIPSPRKGDYTSEFDSPLIADSDDFGVAYRNTPLFDDVGLFEPPSSSNDRAAPPATR